MSQLNSQTGRRLLALGLLAFAAAPAAQADGGVFVEQNGLVAIHMESNPPSGWTLSTSTPGWTGDGYFRWNGPNLFQQPGAQGVFAYDVLISTPGTYTLFLRNRHDDPNPTEHNDVWVKVDNGAWEKVFSNGYTSLPYVGHWSWESRTEHPGFPQATYYLSPGQHRINFSARSYGFKMDRVHLALPNAPNANNVNAPESLRIVGTSYGTAVPNLTGSVGLLEGRGTSFVQFNELSLRASNVPANTFGIFLASQSQGFTPNPGGSAGNLLLGAGYGRFSDVVLTSVSGTAVISANLSALPTAGGVTSAVPGDTWYFQFMHRQQDTSNFTRGLAVTFL